MQVSLCKVDCGLRTLSPCTQRCAGENVGNWIGIGLLESGPGFSPVSAKRILTTAAGKQVRQLVTGDSFRSQHANTAHFTTKSPRVFRRRDFLFQQPQRLVALRHNLPRLELTSPIATFGIAADARPFLVEGAIACGISRRLPLHSLGFVSSRSMRGKERPR